MNRNDKKEYLNQLNDVKKEMLYKELELELLQQRLYDMHENAYDDIKVQKSRAEEAYYARNLESIQMLKEEIQEDFCKIEVLEKELSAVIDQLTGEERLVIRMIYIHGDAIRTIACKIGCSERTIGRRHNSGVDKLDIPNTSAT